jgi:hypothetical protein
MNQLLDALKRSNTIVDYETAPAEEGAECQRLTIWVDAMVTDESLSALLQAVVDRSVETSSSWDLRIGVVVERGRISPREGPVLHRAAEHRR